MQPRPRAFTTCGQRGPGPCQARCRLSMVGSRALGSARGAAARLATPPGPRSLPGSPAAERTGRQLQSPMSSCRWPRGGSAADACSRSGRSMRPRLQGSNVLCRPFAVPGSPGRRAKPASERSSAGSGLSGISAARRNLPRSRCRCCMPRCSSHGSNSGRKLQLRRQRCRRSPQQQELHLPWAGLLMQGRCWQQAMLKRGVL